MKAKHTIKNVLITSGYSEAWIDNILLQMEIETRLEEKEKELAEKTKEVQNNLREASDLFRQMGDIFKPGANVIIGQHITEPEENTDKAC